MLQLDDLSVCYGHHPALSSVSLRVERGEIVALLGANGAGKSSLLKAVARLITTQPNARVTLDGRDLTRLQAHEIVEAGIALVPEGRGVFTDLTVRENLELGAYAQRARAHQARRLAEVVELFPRLAQRPRQRVGTMSGGEQQMVAIGRALMSAPELLLLDEPSLGLSPLLVSELFKAIARIRQMGVSVLLVEQNARKSLAIAQRAYLLANGCITGQGSAAELADDPAVQRAYLGTGDSPPAAAPPGANSPPSTTAPLPAP